MSVVLITGASRGIGAACAEAFARKGYAVAVNYRHSRQLAEDLCAQLRDSFGVRAVPYCADVRDDKAVRAMVCAIEQQLGEIDVLVNNAGVALSALFTQTDEQSWQEIIDTNLSGVYHCCHAVLPSMIRRHSGCVLNISSMWGEVGASCEVAYSAAKAGVIGLTRALSKELAPSNIRVNCIAPGVVMTDMLSGYDADALEALRQDTPLMRLGTPADIAGAAVFLCCDDASFITGQVLGVNGGMV